MTTKSIGANIGGPEDRVVSANLGIGMPVALKLANPIPYRSISVGEINVGTPTIAAYSLPYTLVPQSGGNDIIYRGQAVTRNSAGVVQATITGTAYLENSGQWLTSGFRHVTFSNWVGGMQDSRQISYFLPAKPSMYQWAAYSGVCTIDVSGTRTYSGSWVSLGYEALFAADQAADTGGISTYVVTSNGDTVVRELQQSLAPSHVDFKAGSDKWSGAGYVDMFREVGSYEANPGWYYHHKLAFEVPEDCVHPVTPIPPPYPGVQSTTATYTEGPYIETGSDWIAGDNGSIGHPSTQTSAVTITGPGGSRTINGIRRTVSSGVLSRYQPMYWTEKVYYATITYENYAGVSPTWGVLSVVNGSTGPAGSTLTPTWLQDTPEWIAVSQAHADQQRWNADWFAGQAMLKLRRKNWFKKNSDTTLSQIISGTFSMSAKWDYSLKRNAQTSSYTYRPILMSVAIADTEVRDAYTVNAQLGWAAQRYTTTRTATFSYSVPITQPNGEVTVQTRRKVIVGTREEIVVDDSVVSNNAQYTVTFLNWYVPAGSRYPAGLTLEAKEEVIWHQFLLDKSTNGVGTGLLWDGMTEFTSGRWIADSRYSLPPNNPMTPTRGLERPYSNTLRGAAPEFVRTYRKEVPIKYDATGALASTAWNDSAVYDGQIMRVTFFGPKDKGIFGEWEDTDTELSIFGEATYKCIEGNFTLVSWTPPKTPTRVEKYLGIDIPSRDIPCPSDGLCKTTNSIVEYCKLKWPDIRAQAKQFSAELQGRTAQDSTYVAVREAMAYVPPK